MAGKGKLFSLDTYEAEAEKEYKSYKIRVSEDTVVTLYNPIRISEQNRTRLFALIPEMSFEGDEAKTEDLARMEPLILEMLELVGDENVGLLISRLRNDLSITMKVFQDYFKEIGLGEASVSES